MKYENGSEVLPPELLKEVQKYAAGKLLYIPKSDERKSWGELSGYRDKLLKRNIMMRNQYNNGVTLAHLADEYFLSMDTVKKIIYRKQIDGSLSFDHTLSSAIAYSNMGFLEEWILTYEMCQGGPIIEVNGECHYYGVVYLPLRLINMPQKAQDRLKDETREIPLFITFHSKKFWVINQLSRYKALIQERRNSYPCIILIETEEEYNYFMNMYDGLLQMVK